MFIRSAIARSRRIAKHLLLPKGKTPSSLEAADRLLQIRTLLVNLQSESPEQFLIRTGPKLEDVGKELKDVTKIEISDSCNLESVMCRTSQARRKKGLMDIGLFEECVAWLAEQGFTSTTLHTIGDPLANKQLGRYLEVLRRYGIAVDSLSSNCQLLDRHLDTIFEFRDVIKRFRPSLDAACKDVYEKIRVGGSWTTLHRNLLDFALRNERSENPFPVRISNIICADNYHELAFIPHVFSYLAPPTHFTFGFINSLSPDNGYFFSSRLIDKILLNRPCRLPFHSAYILKEGTFSLCCRDYHGEVAFGSVAEWREKDETAIERHRKSRDAIRRAHIDGNLDDLPELCQTCHCVDPRIYQLFALLFSHFFLDLGGHPAQLQDFLNRSLPSLRSGGYETYATLLGTL